MILASLVRPGVRAQVLWGLIDERIDFAEVPLSANRGIGGSGVGDSGLKGSCVGVSRPCRFWCRGNAVVGELRSCGLCCRGVGGLKGSVVGETESSGFCCRGI